MGAIITLTTDFGLNDYYVAAVKAVLLRTCPDATLVDVTHAIGPQDVLGGAIALERAVQSFYPGTVHLGVVDPGVGTRRRILVAQVRGQWVVCPDNGMITWTQRRCGPLEYRALFWRPTAASDVFHARDVMAPVAGMLAAGRDVHAIARPIDDPILLDLALAEDQEGTIIHVDRFGNCTTNIPAEVIRRLGRRLGRCQAYVGNRRIGPIRRRYAQASVGAALALIGSSGLLEIAVRDGSAAQILGIGVGEAVGYRRTP